MACRRAKAQRKVSSPRTGGSPGAHDPRTRQRSRLGVRESWVRYKPIAVRTIQAGEGRRVRRLERSALHFRLRHFSPLMRKKLLLADDDVNAMAAVAVFFESHNFEVRTATDGITALRWFSTWQPDAAMLDIDMPGASGYEVARHVRSTESSGKRTLLVAVTGEMPPREVAARCYQAGFDLHVAKPADGKSLAEFVILGIAG